MTWGKGIIAALALFIGFILYLAITLMSQKVDLESEDYYAQEIKYENDIKAEENALNLNSIITISQNNSHVTIQIPDSLNVSNLVASFIRPNDNLLDKDFKIGGTNTFLIDKKELKKGLYNIELRFKNDDIDCLQKSTLYL